MKKSSQITQSAEQFGRGEPNETQQGQDKGDAIQFCKANDFMPKIAVEGQNLEVVEEFNLLGVIFTSDLKWKANTDFITKKA